MEEQDIYTGNKWDSALTPEAEGFLPRRSGESPWTDMLAPVVISRPSYTEGAKAEAVALEFWLLLHVKLKLYQPGTHKRDEDASSGITIVSVVAPSSP